ncbi:uncharacterized protein [Gorilla gorilla gorilla]|uniref:uncharacterized protein n=1 Tax=Gorilla gorilla gorilla TaxID=9595 RepID=UPI00123E670A|nr:uncharacterized protein LOC109029306 [Gorilla gorilla gorilla]
MAQLTPLFIKVARRIQVCLRGDSKPKPSSARPENFSVSPRGAGTSSGCICFYKLGYASHLKTCACQGRTSSDGSNHLVLATTEEGTHQEKATLLSICKRWTPRPRSFHHLKCK